MSEPTTTTSLTNRLAARPDVALALLRVTLGVLMLTHGWPKAGKLFVDPVQFADPIGVGPTASLWLAVLAEVGCSLLLILGVYARAAAIPLLITMLVAAFVVHGDDPFRKQEFALLYALGYLVIAIGGPGRWALLTLAGRRRPTQG